jgi:hypothetical protein
MKKSADKLTSFIAIHEIFILVVATVAFAFVLGEAGMVNAQF